MVVHRHPVSIAKSLKRRNNVPISVGLVFWYHQTRMIASSLVNEKNVHHVNLFEHGQTPLKLSEIFKRILKTDSDQFSMGEDVVQTQVRSDLIHHQSSFDDIPKTSELAYIERAWELSRQGHFKELLELPELEKLTLSVNELSGSYSSLIESDSNLQDRLREKDLSLIHI